MHAPPIRIGILVCTVQRPRMLTDCLRSLLAQTVPKGWKFEICVIENDAAPHLRPVVAACAAESRIPIHYDREPRRGIPFARNKAIEVALRHDYDWLVWIDDDETARDDWLMRLIETQARFDADVVSGQVMRCYDRARRDWGPKPSPTPPGPTGTECDHAATNNTLFSSDLVRPDGLNLRFDERLVCGGEDADFFIRARERGRRIVWCEEAVVNDNVPPSRVARHRVLQRMAQETSSKAYRARLRDGFWHAYRQMGRKAPRRIVIAVLMIGIGHLLRAFAPERGKRTRERFRSRFVRNFGTIRGLLGYPTDFYATIDGD